MIRIWNLPKALTDQLVADHEIFRVNLKNVQTNPTTAELNDKERARRLHKVIEEHIVELWAGYGPDQQMLFRGDPITIRPRVRDGQDFVCEIEVGDGFVALEEQWMAQVYGVGEVPANVLSAATALATAGSDDAKIRAAIGIVAPNAVTARLANGWVGQGRPADTIKEVADFLGLVWWYRDGKVEFVERDKYLPDFAVELNANSSLLSTGLTDDGRYRVFDCVLSPQVHPGRAVQIIDEDGKRFRGRILETRISGDTHSDDWHISGLCDASDWQALPMVEAGRGPRLQTTAEDWERQTNPKTGGQQVPKALRFKRK